MTERLGLFVCSTLWLLACSPSSHSPDGGTADGKDFATSPDGGQTRSTAPPSNSGMGGTTGESGSSSEPLPLPDSGGYDVAPPICTRGATPQIASLDVLFIVDNSGSMREEQAALRAEFPRLFQALAASGSLHLGVVSTDMGVVGIQDIEGCVGLGDDGILQNAPSPDVQGCQPSYPKFLTFDPGVSDPATTANDLACIASLGTDGCGFEQQLEAGLKALWPSVDADPSTGAPLQPNRIQFLGDATGFGRLGHGDLENAGFLRNDGPDGPSLILIVLVTDEEDCSSADISHFTPSHFLDPNSPLAMQDIALRCFYNPQNLYPIERYSSGLRALRPNNESLVMFAAIAGVPPDLVSPAALTQVDFTDAASRAELYESILNDPRMIETLDPTRLEQGGNLIPSCDTERGTAHPPRRIVELASEFGSNGIVQSICEEDFGPGIDAILGRVTARLEDLCAP